jgi:three-Cys-motif partner protein
LHRFHQTKKSAAVLKDGIIDSYAPPFIGKTGKWSTDNRVAFIDGYAGPGRYEDDEEGSGAMLLRHARKHAPMPQKVKLHFVEEHAETVLVRAVRRRRHPAGHPTLVIAPRIPGFDDVPDQGRRSSDLRFVFWH